MRDTREWSDIVFQVSVAIIVIELVVLSIGFNLAAGVGVAVWVLSFYDIRTWKPSKGKAVLGCSPSIRRPGRRAPDRYPPRRYFRHFMKAGVMRTKSFILAFIAATIVPTLSASAANVGCVSSRFVWHINRTTHVQASTLAGQPCQIRFFRSSRVGEVAVLQTVVKPAHGVLGISAKEGNRRFIAYVPSPGFVGRDRFEVHIEEKPSGGGTLSGNVQVDIDVTR